MTIASLMEAPRFVQRKYMTLRALIAKTQLENELATIIRTVAGHKKNGIKRGDEVYRALNSMAETKVERFCERFSYPVQDIRGQIPALFELKLLASEPVPQKRWAQVLLFLSSGAVGLVLIGMASSMIHHFVMYGYQVSDLAIQWLKVHL